MENWINWDLEHSDRGFQREMLSSLPGKQQGRDPLQAHSSVLTAAMPWLGLPPLLQGHSLSDLLLLPAPARKRSRHHGIHLQPPWISVLLIHQTTLQERPETTQGNQGTDSGFLYIRALHISWTPPALYGERNVSLTF